MNHTRLLLTWSDIMIGFEYVIMIRGIQKADVAMNFELAPSTVGDWTSGRRKISMLRQDQLEQYLNIPKELLSKEATKEIKLKILKLEYERLKQTNDI